MNDDGRESENLETFSLLTQTRNHERCIVILEHSVTKNAPLRDELSKRLDSLKARKEPQPTIPLTFHSDYQLTQPPTTYPLGQLGQHTSKTAPITIQTKEPR